MASRPIQKPRLFFCTDSWSTSLSVAEVGNLKLDLRALKCRNPIFFFLNTFLHIIEILTVQKPCWLYRRFKPLLNLNLTTRFLLGTWPLMKPYIMILQPSQNRRAAGSTNHLLQQFDRLLAVRNILFLLTTRREEKRKKEMQRTIIQAKRKVPEHYSKGLKALL